MQWVWKGSYCSQRPLPRFLVSTLQMGSFLLSSVSLSQECSPQTSSLWFSWECPIKSWTAQFQHRLLSYNWCKKCHDKQLATWTGFHQSTQSHFHSQKRFSLSLVIFYLCVCVCLFMYVCIFLYVCISVRVYMCAYFYMCVCLWWVVHKCVQLYMEARCLLWAVFPVLLPYIGFWVKVSSDIIVPGWPLRLQDLSLHSEARVWGTCCPAWVFCMAAGDPDLPYSVSCLPILCYGFSNKQWDVCSEGGTTF